MILVTLGTQDKSFKRLLDAISKEIDKGTIKDKVVVQAGYTKYKNDKMEIFSSLPSDELEELIKKADLIITHGGVGSILTALKYKKKVIVAPRLSKYNEHTNDHQKEITKEFAKEGYILPLNDFNKLDKVIEKSKKFIPKEYKSNNENFKKLITDYIDDTNHISWYNRDKFVILTSLINFLIFIILLKLNINVYLDFTISYLISCFIIILLKVDKLNNKLTAFCCFYLIEGLSLLLASNLYINFIIAKLFINILCVIIYHFLAKKN